MKEVEKNESTFEGVLEELQLVDLLKGIGVIRIFL